MEMNLVELWHHMGTPVRAVVIVLTLQAVACISVVVDRLIMLAVSRTKSKRFALAAGKPMSRGDYSAVVELTKEKRIRGSHLAQLIGAGISAFTQHVSQGLEASKAAQLTTRALERTGDNLSASLHRGMNVLASTGSTAPFVGLLGTVLGILNAFKLIADQGSGGLGTIGAAIGEALVVTGYGLTVAIPSVLFFNWMSGRIAAYERGLANAAGELVDTLEAGGASASFAAEVTAPREAPVQSKTGRNMEAVAATA